MELTEQEKTLINTLSGGIPLSLNPYSDIAQTIGLTEETVLDKIKEFQERGIIRRLGAVLNHRKSGFTYNAMSVWEAEEEKIRQTVQLMISYPQISHCYRRRTHPPNWPYNLYAVIHGQREGECEQIAGEISEKSGVKKYKLLYSIKEYKKSPTAYFF